MAEPTVYEKSFLEGTGGKLLHLWDESGGVFRAARGDASGNLIIAAGDLQIGAMELKDASGSNRAAISSAGALSIDQVSRGYSASASFTPAAASHVAGDSIGVAAEFALGAPSGARLKIISASLLIAGATIETTAWALHMFSVTPPSALTDDAAFLLASGDRASYLGKIDIAQVVDLGDTLFQDTGNIFKAIKLTGTSFFAYLVNGTTLTPQAVAHTVTVHAEAF